MKKKSFIAIIAIMIIATTFAVMFTGCASKADPDELMTKLQEGIRAAYGTNNIDNISIAANAQLDIKKDKEKKPSSTFSVEFATQLDLNGANGKNGLKLIVKENDKILLGAWYKDINSTKKDNTMYVQYLDSKTQSDTKLNVKVPNVKTALTSKNVKVDGAAVTTDIQNANILPLIGDILGLLDNEKGTLVKPKVSATKASFSLPLTAILTPQKKEKNNSQVYNTTINQANIFDMLYPYTQALGVYLNVSDLSSILPNIMLDFECKFDKATKALTGITFDLSLDKKEVKINSATANGDLSTPGTENADKPIISIGIPHTYKLKLAVSDVVIAPANLAMSTFAAPFTDGKAVSALNFKFEGKLSTSADINVDLATFGLDATTADLITNLLGTTKIALPKDNYAIIIEADIDPTKLLDITSFSQNCSPYITGTSTKLKETAGGATANYADGSKLSDADATLLADRGIAWVMNKTGVTELENLVGSLLKMINYVNIELKGTGSNVHQFTIQRDQSGNKDTLNVTKLVALGINLPNGINLALDGVVKNILGLIYPVKNANDKNIIDEVKPAAPTDVKYDQAFINAHKTPAGPVVPVTPPTAAELNMRPGQPGWMAKYVGPVLQKLNVKMFGACAEGNWLEASLAKHFFTGTDWSTGKGVDGVDMLAVTVKNITAGKNGLDASIIVDINPTFENQTIKMIRGIIGNHFELGLGITSFQYGGCRGGLIK